MEDQNDLRKDLKIEITKLIKEKLKEKVNVDIDCLLCILLNDTGQEFIIKIHETLRSDSLSTSISTQVEENLLANNVSLEDTLSKGTAETPPIKDQEKGLDRDDCSETTVVGSNHSDRESPTKDVEGEKRSKDDIAKEAEELGVDEGHLDDVQEHLNDDPFEDISQEFDEINDIEEHFTGDEANISGQDEMFFQTDILQYKERPVKNVKGQLECPIKAVEGQFDDISEESQVEDNMVLKGSSIVKDSEILQMNKTDKEMDETFKESIVEISVRVNENGKTNDQTEQVETSRMATVDVRQRMEEVGIVMEKVAEVTKTDDTMEVIESPNDVLVSTDVVSTSTTNVAKEMPTISEELPEVHRVCPEGNTSDKDTNDIVLLIDDDDEVAEKDIEKSQPTCIPVEEPEEPEIQMTWEKPPSSSPSRKRSYPKDNPGGITAAKVAARNASPTTLARPYNVPGVQIVPNTQNPIVRNMGNTATGVNSIPSRTNIAMLSPTSLSPRSTSDIGRSTNMPQASANRYVTVQNFSQGSSLNVSAMDKVEYGCGICSIKVGEYAELSQHLETAHEFHIFLSCVLCHEYFPNRYTFIIHRQLKHKDQNYFRCPQCNVGFGTEECQYHRQECRPPQSQAAPPNKPQATNFAGRTFQNPPTTRQVPVQRQASKRNILNTYPYTYAQQVQNNRFQGNVQRSGVQPMGTQRIVPNTARSTGTQRIMPNTGRHVTTQCQLQYRHSQSQATVPRFSSAPARSVLNSPVSMRPQSQSAPPRRRLDRSFQYVCDQCNTNFSALKEYEIHCLDAHNRYVCPVCSLSFPSRNLANRHLSMHTA